MTTIILNGILGKIFRKNFKLHLGRINDFANAIDSIFKNFKLKLKELAEKGYNYVYRYDEKNKELNIIPLIGGSGKTVLIVIAVIIIILAVIFAPFTIAGFASLLGSTGSAGAAAAAAGASLSFAQLAGVYLVQTLFMTGISLLIQGLMMEPLKTPQAELRATGGAVYASAAAGKSYVFTGTRNIATQGTSVPIGYGRMKVGSRLVHLTMKSFSTSLTFEQVANNQVTNSVDIYD
jgi:predicted phage tail protein